MNTIVVLGHEKWYILNLLLTSQSKVTVINNYPDDCERLASQYEHQVVCGDASKPAILEHAGIARCDLLIAADIQDANNFVICDLAKRKYGVSQTLAVITEAENCTVFKRLGIDQVLCPNEILSDIIEGTLQNLLKK